MKSILVTGAGSGVGFEVVKLFLEKGFKVGGLDINVKALNELQAQGQANLFAYKCDVSCRAGVHDAIEQFATVCGGVIDVVHSNAGIQASGLFKDVELEKYEMMNLINAMGTIYIIKEALPYVMASEAGAILLTSSASAITGLPMFSVYGATKSFVTSLGESLSIELESDGIYLGIIEPGLINTPMNSNNPDSMVCTEQEITLGPKEVAEAAYQAISTRRQLYWHVGEEAHDLAEAIQGLRLQERQRFVKQMIQSKLK